MSKLDDLINRSESLLERKFGFAKRIVTMYVIKIVMENLVLIIETKNRLKP